MSTATSAVTEKAKELEEEGKKIPLSEFTVADIHEVIQMNAHGLLAYPSTDKYDSRRMDWWEMRIRKWKEKQA